MKRADRAVLSQESVRGAVQWLLVAAAGLASLTPLIPDAGARALCLRAAAFVLLLDAALLLYYGLRFGRAFLAFLARRVCLMAVTLVGITLVTFVVVRFAPGDPVSASAGLDGGAEDVTWIDREVDFGRTREGLLGSRALHTFRARATDPDGDLVSLEFDWGDETPLDRSREVAPRTVVARTHRWRGPGDYSIRVRAIDEHGARSAWSVPLRVEARQGESPPPTPPRPRGPPVVVVGTPAEPYSVDVASSREDLTVLIDWGDDTRSPASQRGERGERTRSHTWKTGIFQVRARFVGDHDAVSAWSTPLEVVAFEADSRLAGPLLTAARDHAPSGSTLTFMARAVSRGASDLQYALRVREAGASGSPPREPGRAVVARSGDLVELSRVFLTPGEYLVDVSVEESGGGSPPRVSAAIPVTIDDTNGPPLTPEPPYGPERMRVETTIFEQYFSWLTKLARFDFGRSHRYSREVWPLIWKERLPTTLILSAISLLLAYLIAIPIGVYSSTHRDAFPDRCLSVTLFTLYSLPSFWVATMFIVLAVDFPRVPIRDLSCSDPSAHPFGPDAHVAFLGLCLGGVVAMLVLRLGRLLRLRDGLARTLGAVVGVSLGVASALYLPASELTRGLLLGVVPLMSVVYVFTPSRPDESPGRSFLAAARVAVPVLFVLVFVGRLFTFDLFWHALLPVTCLTYGGLAVLSRYTRSGMLDVLRQDFVRTARAKGLPERTVIFKHALRNGLIPIVTLFASVFPQLISGSVIVESIFTIEGMGQLMVESVRGRDYNITMAVTTITAIMTMLGLLLSDVLYAVVDPRISFDRRTSS